MQREANSSVLFRHWLKVHPMESCVFEMKDTGKATSLPYSAVAQAQIDYCIAIEGDRGVLLRMQAVTEGMPDYSYFRNGKAYIVIKYPKCFCLIRIKDFIKEKETSSRKSLTVERAVDISELTIKL